MRLYYNYYNKSRLLSKGVAKLTITHYRRGYVLPLSDRRTYKTELIIAEGRGILDQNKIIRINELARKSKETGLSPEELEERQLLRKEYLAAVRANLKNSLDQIKFMPDKPD